MNKWRPQCQIGGKISSNKRQSKVSASFIFKTQAFRDWMMLQQISPINLPCRQGSISPEPQCSQGERADQMSACHG